MDQVLQAMQGLLAVLLQASVLLGLDDDDAFVGDALIAQCEKPFFHCLGQGGGSNVKAQVCRRGDLVHILAACTLGADSVDVNFFQRYGQAMAHKVGAG